MNLPRWGSSNGFSSRLVGHSKLCGCIFFCLLIQWIVLKSMRSYNSHSHPWNNSGFKDDDLLNKGLFYLCQAFFTTCPLAWSVRRWQRRTHKLGPHYEDIWVIRIFFNRICFSDLVKFIYWGGAEKCVQNSVLSLKQMHMITFNSQLFGLWNSHPQSSLLVSTNFLKQNYPSEGREYSEHEYYFTLWKELRWKCLKIIRLTTQSYIYCLLSSYFLALNSTCLLLGWESLTRMHDSHARTLHLWSFQP